MAIQAPGPVLARPMGGLSGFGSLGDSSAPFNPNNIAGDRGFPGYTDANGVFRNYPTGTASGTADTGGGGIQGWESLLGGIGSLLYGKPDMALAQQIAGQSTQGTHSALDKLAGFMNDPNAVTKMPGYQFGMDQGLDAVNRGAGASGLLNSGNRLAALQNQGQAYAGTWMDRMYNQLTGNVNANVAGGKLDLGAGQFLTDARQRQKIDLGGGIGGILQGLPGAVGGLSSLWNYISKLTGGGGGGGSSGWNSGYDLPGGGDTQPGWTSGSDLPTGGMGIPEPPGWTSGFDIGGGGLGDWTSGFDLGMG